MDMKKVTRQKTVAVILLLSVVLSIASCSSDKSKNKKVSADSPWYDAEIIDFKPETRTDKTISSMYSRLAGSDEDYIAVYSEGEYRVAENVDELDYRDCYIEIVSLIDRKTKQTVKNIDLTEVLGSYEYAHNVNYTNGIITIYGDSWDPETNKYVLMIVLYNPPLMIQRHRIRYHLVYLQLVQNLLLADPYKHD